MPYFDMHCHLDFAPNAQEAAAELNALGLGAFAVSVLPNVRFGDGTGAPLLKEQEAEPCLNLGEDVFASKSGVPEPSPTAAVKWGTGLHPWWIASGRAGENELEILLGAIETNCFVGEVGLDFGKTYGTQQEAQVQAFSRIAQACAAAGRHVLSIHAVRAAHTALDILQEAGTLDTCTCIFHWFSDSSDALARAAKAGCYFSIGEPMLQSKRGREYARQIPAERLLLETDKPAQGASYVVANMQRQLARTCATIAALRGLDEVSLASRIAETSRFILGT